MSVPKFKRKPSGLEYIDNAYELQQEIMNLCSKLSARWARIYQQPIDKLAFLQADLVNMAYSITPQNNEDYLIRRIFLLLSRCCLNAMEVRITAMVSVLYNNPSKCFNRKNGKNYSYNDSYRLALKKIKLDKKLENLGVKYQRQYDLIKGVLAADKRKYGKLSSDNLSDKEIIEIMVSKLFKIFCE